MRIWSTRIDESRVEEYEEFAHSTSLPMFEAQPGFRGLLFGRNGSECAVITLWHDDDAADAMESSASYQQAVAAINAAGFLVGNTHVERFLVHAPTPLHDARAGMN